MWVFPKRRFDVVWHTFNPRTGKIFHMHLTIFQRMSEMISSNMFDNAVSQEYHLFLFALACHLSAQLRWRDCYQVLSTIAFVWFDPEVI